MQQASCGLFFIVQARPITTLRGQTPALEEWNDSLSGDYLWSCANVGEAVPDVMTPCTWSLIQIFLAKTMGPLFLIGLRYHPLGNIGGRFYKMIMRRDHSKPGVSSVAPFSPSTESLQ